jgi:hypothetical protein
MGIFKGLLGEFSLEMGDATSRKTARFTVKKSLRLALNQLKSPLNTSTASGSNACSACTARKAITLPYRPPTT